MWFGPGRLGLTQSCLRAAQGPTCSLHHVSIPEQTRDAGSIFYFLVPSLCFICHESLLFQDVSKYTLEHTVVTGTLTSTETHVAGLPGSLRKRLWARVDPAAAQHVQREGISLVGRLGLAASGLWSEGSTPGLEYRFNVIGSFIRIFILIKLLKVLTIEGLESMVGLGDTEVAVSSTGIWDPCCGLGGVLGQ